MTKTPIRRPGNNNSNNDDNRNTGASINDVISNVQPRRALHNAVTIPVPRLPIHRVMRPRSRWDQSLSSSSSSEADEPFIFLMFKVGSTLLLIIMSSYLIWIHQNLLSPYSISNAITTDFLNHNENTFNLPLRSSKWGGVKSGTSGVVSPLIPLDTPLDPNDAFGLAESVDASSPSLNSLDNSNNNNKNNHTYFGRAAAELRSDFSDRYGGPVMARALLGKAWTTPTYPNQTAEAAIATHLRLKAASHDKAPLFRLAKRILQKQQQRHQNVSSSSTSSELVVLVMGSSAAAGVGNYRNQSYPEVLRVLLDSVFDPTSFPTPSLQLINLAMEDTSEFPLTWCLEQYLVNGNNPNDPTAHQPKNRQQQQHGTVLPLLQPDVVIWDFGGDSASSPPERLEAFLNNMIDRKVPMIFVRNIRRDQYAVLQHYAQVIDIVVLMEQTAVKPYLHAIGRPDGLIDYNKFGIAKRSSHVHLSIKRHEWIAWIISMHILASLERVFLPGISSRGGIGRSTSMKPAPLFLNEIRDRPWSALFFDETVIHSRKCFTTYDMVVRARNMSTLHGVETSNLHDIVLEKHGTDREVLLPKTKHYNMGWVLDLDDSTKQSKLLSKDTDFHGFPDWKQAYYGLPQSGTLQFVVPLSAENNASSSSLLTTTILIVCESDSPQYQDSCALERDVAFDVGGVPTGIEVLDTKIVGVFEKQNCVQVKIPSHASLMTLEETSTSDNKVISNYGTVGLSVNVRVTNDKVSLKKGPCSIANVVIFQTTDL